MEVNKIYNENCLYTMEKMPDNFIDLVVTSPPYDDLRDYNGYVFDYKPIAKELFRVTKIGGVVVWVIGDAVINGGESGTSFRQALFFMECGFNLHDTMIFHKEKIPTEHTRYQQHFEYMFIFSKGNPLKFNPIKEKSFFSGEKKTKHSNRNKDGTMKMGRTKLYVSGTKVKGNVWKYSVGYNQTTKDDCYKHPAMFPEKLARDHILSWSNEGDLVYDPFIGSGTTAKMAHELKRNWIGSEISKKYTDLANKRIDPYLRQLKLI